MHACFHPRILISGLPGSRIKFEIIPPNYYVLLHYDNPIVLNCTLSYTYACEPRIRANVHHVYSRSLNLSVAFDISPFLERDTYSDVLNEPSYKMLRIGRFNPFYTIYVCPT